MNSNFAVGEETDGLTTCSQSPSKQRSRMCAILSSFLYPHASSGVGSKLTLAQNNLKIIEDSRTIVEITLDGITLAGIHYSMPFAQKFAIRGFLIVRMRPIPSRLSIFSHGGHWFKIHTLYNLSPQIFIQQPRTWRRFLLGFPQSYLWENDKAVF